MKFEYDKKKDDCECVAYIDRDGDLMVLEDSGDAVCFNATNGEIRIGFAWDPENANHKFYPGDKITITF